MACNDEIFEQKGLISLIQTCIQSFAYSFYFQNWELFSLFERSNFRPEVPAVEIFFTNVAKTLASLTASWPEFEPISKKFACISHEGFLKQYKAYVPSDEEFFVLIHGDMWTNNFFYKYGDSKRPTDVMLVSNWSFAFSIFAIDTHFFSLTSRWQSGFRLLSICSLWFSARRVATFHNLNGTNSFKFTTPNWRRF